MESPAVMLSKITHPFRMAGIYLVCAVGDFLSSMPKLPVGYYEANPFARHPDGSFWPLHALANFGISTSADALISLGLYAGFVVLNKKLAQFMAGLPWLYFAYFHLIGAISNIQVKFLFVPHLEDSFLQFLRGLVG